MHKIETEKGEQMDVWEDDSADLPKTVEGVQDDGEDEDA